MQATALLLALLVVTPAVAADRATSPSAPTANAETQIRAALANWTQAANRGDWKAASAVWAPDLIGWAPAGDDDTYAREMAGAASAAKAPPTPPTTTYALEINEVLVDATMAVVRDTWTMTEKTGTPSTPSAKVSRFRSFEIWRLQPDGSWKIARWIDGPVAPVPH